METTLVDVVNAINESNLELQTLNSSLLDQINRNFEYMQFFTFVQLGILFFLIVGVVRNGIHR